MDDAWSFIRKNFDDFQEWIISDTPELDKEKMSGYFYWLKNRIVADSPVGMKRYLQDIFEMYNPSVDYEKGQARKKLMVESLRILEPLVDAERISIFGPKKEPYVFLSHNARNNKHINALRDLFTGIGISNAQIVCTSHAEHKIPLCHNIYEYLKGYIRSDSMVVILWTDAYFESLPCMCEVGAAWAMGCQIINVFDNVETLKNPNFLKLPIDPKDMGIVLNGDDICKRGIGELVEKAIDLFCKRKEALNIKDIAENFIKKI
jgi:hypothetical protein